jgi:hypothetical protein
MKKLIITLFTLIVSSGISYTLFLSADTSINWPVNLPRNLSATLGEIRGMSLHQGIDIKTNGRPGYPVFAAGSGNISRIISKENGYGNALFIDHGNGMESAYGHLDSFDEGKHHLDSIVRTLKILYNESNLDFRLFNSKIFFNKDEKIAGAGESGSGLPHLHFEIRDNNIFLNPLDFIHIKDTIPPVIEKIFLCTEQDNSTISETEIQVKRSRGIYTAGKGQVSVSGEKIFFKISCYDSVGAYNHVSVYRIKLQENNKKIFEFAFDNLTNDDISNGAFVYDISKSTIKNGVTYSYFLCKKEGNTFSGIKTQTDGYIYLKEKDKKDINISVSDFAGNEETCVLKIIREENNSVNMQDYIKAARNKKTSITDNKKNAKITIQEDSVFADTLLKIESTINPQVIDELCKAYPVEKKDIINIISVLPHDSVYKKPVTVYIKRPSGIPEEDAKHIQIFHFFENKKPTALKTTYMAAEQAFQAESYLNGYFALIMDKIPPKIFLPPTFELCEDREFLRKIRLNTSDNISKINKDTIQCIVDGEIFPSIFDEDRKWIEIALPRNVISSGMHHVFVKACDGANNEAVFRGLLIFK